MIGNSGVRRLSAVGGGFDRRAVSRLLPGALVFLVILTLGLGEAVFGQNPTCSIAVGTALICDGDLVQEVTVTYNEAMSATPAPTIQFVTAIGIWAPGSGIWDLAQHVWTQSFTVSDANEETSGIDVYVSGAQNAGGAPQVPNTLVDAFNVDTRNPSAPLITWVADDNGSSDADGITNDNRLILSGTAESQSSIRLYRDGSSIGTTSASGVGAWTFDYQATALADGTYHFKATATDLAGNVSPESAPLTALVDTQAPPAPAARAPADGTWTNDNTPTFLWIAPSDPGGSGVYQYHYQVRTTIPPVTAAKDGTTANTTYTPTAATPDGSYTWRLTSRDRAGNTGAWSADWSLVIDTGPPTVTILANDVAIYDGDVGVDRFSVTATFSEAMSTGVAPSVAFSPDPTQAPATFMNPSGAWGGTGGNTAYTWTYDAVDVGVTVSDVDITVSGGRDVAGNLQVSSTNADYVDVDTANPSVSTAVADTLLVVDGDLTQQITVTFSEAMKVSAVLAITFSVGTWSPGAAGTWTVGNTVWARTFTLTDNQETAANVTADVAGAQDAAGNDQQTYTPQSEFNIDTQNPTVTSIVASDLLIGDADAGTPFTVTVDFSEAMSSGLTPMFVFSPSVATTLAFSSGGWLDADTYRAVYIVTDVDVDQDSVTVDVINAKDAAGNDQQDFTAAHEFEIDTRNPQATVTVDRTPIVDGSPIYEGALVLTVAVTYDEAMNTSTTPVITLENEGSNWGGQTPLGWTGNTVYRATFTHNGTEEPTPPVPALVAFARVPNTSGATDLAGNADVGDDSPTFEIDTRKPEVGQDVAAVAVDTDPVYEGDLVPVVTATFDEAMRADGTAEPVITFSAGTWAAGGAGVWSMSDTVWTRSYTLTDNNEEVADVTVDVAGACDVAGNAQENYIASREFTIDTLQPSIVEIDAEGHPSCGGFYCSGAGDTVVVSVTFSEGVVLASGIFGVMLDVLPSGFEIVYPTGKFAPPTGLPVRWNDYTIDQNYVVQAGHNSCDLESTAVGWTVPALTDVAGNPAITDMPPLDSRIKALRDIIVDTTPPQAFGDPGVSDTYVYVQPAYLSWHEFVEDRERIIAREDCPIYIDVLSNDFDNCSGGLSVTTATIPAPSYGVTSLFTDGGTGHYPVLSGACDAKVVRYSPYSDYTGPDEFGYTARDCSGNTSDAMVYLYVFAKNSLGSVVPNAFSGVPAMFRLETRDDLLLRIADAERFGYRFALPVATEHGVLTWTDDAIVYDHGIGSASLDLVYTSADGYEGVDVFTWSVTDPFGIVQEKAESFSVVQADAGLVPLVATLELRRGGMAHLAVPGGLFDVGGVAAIRIQRLGAFGEVVEELAPSDVAQAIAVERSRGNGVLGLDASTLPSGLLRLVIPVGDGTMCSVVVEIGGGGGQ